MKRILILSERLDIHAAAVEWGLARLGEATDWWDRSQFPNKSCISVSLSRNGGVELSASGTSVSVESNYYKSIWNRRGRNATVSERLTRPDRVVAQSESSYFLKGVMTLLERRNCGSLFVNSPQSSRRAEEKLSQLATAQRVGFTIPDTVISNDPYEIRKFYRSKDQVIAKQHVLFCWRNPDGTLATLGTSRITDELLAHDFPLMGAPMIYQEYLDIDYEIRVTIFGDTQFAVRRPRSGDHVGNIRDIKWDEELAFEYKLEAPHLMKCREFMKIFDLNFATFDIAVTKDARQLFLECNEAGQFLFIEAKMPSLHVLDAFCQYLASGDPQFAYKESNADITWSNFRSSEAGKAFEAETSEHVRHSKKFSPLELSEELA